MENGPISVIEIQTTEQLVAKPAGPLIDFGGRHKARVRKLELHAKRLPEMLQDGSKRVFRLAWKGYKVPEGAQVLDHVIGWTQAGQVVSQSGKYIGTYDRIVEFGGWNRNEHELVIFLFNRK